MNTIVLRRRLFYICAIVALVVPLYFLGRPSVRKMDGEIEVAGGTLAQIRDHYDLGQGDLGEIEPASESMRLATLGLRGVAATILWQKAEFYKREQYWDRLSATLNQIVALQPHFIEIWKFQSHNMSYNVSTQFDNYRHRYQWVKKGMDYLVRGSKVNKNRTEMPFELGWFFGNKMGVSDEKKQYRELYRNDIDFHEDILAKTNLDVRQKEGRGPDQKPDSWLSGRLWYQRAYEMVEAGASPAKSSLMFYVQGPMWLMKYAESIQSDGYLDEAARFAWRSAERDWRDFGQRQILTTFGDTIYLTEIERANKEFTEATEEFKEFCGETYKELRQKKLDTLSPAEREAMDKPYFDRTFDEVLLAETAELKTTMDPTAVAKALPDDERRIKALQMAKDMVAKRNKIAHIEVYRNQINYSYWEQRCLAEQEQAALLARTNMYEADKLLEKAELDGAFEAYEAAFENWSKLFNSHPAMMIDDVADEVIASVQRYQQLLDVDELPEDFPLNDFLEFRDAYEEQFADPAMLGVIASWPKNYPGRNFLKEMLRKSEQFEQQYKAGEIKALNPENAPQDEGDPTEIQAPKLPQEDAKEATDGDVTKASNPKEDDSAVSANEKPEEAPVQETNQAEQKAEVQAEVNGNADASPVAPSVDKPEAGTPPGPKPKKDEKSAGTESANASSSEPAEEDSTESKEVQEKSLEVSKPEDGSAPGPKKDS